MRTGQVFVVYRPTALAMAKSKYIRARFFLGLSPRLRDRLLFSFSMRRRQAKDPSSVGDQRLCTKENCLSCCKKFTAFMFSRVGLFFVMIGYVALGGWLFQALEAQNELERRQSMSAELNSTLYKLWDEILRVNSYPFHDKKGNFTLYATQQLEKFEETVIKQVLLGFDGRTGHDAHPDWNYFGAILYAVTLVSTIGYGHITTKTIPGKIATILYSAFGVPLMMLFVANIGSTMAKMFAFVFSRITMIFCCRWRKKRRRKSLKNRSVNNQPAIVLNEKFPIDKSTTKSNLKRTKEEQEAVIKSRRKQFILSLKKSNFVFLVVTDQTTESKPRFHLDSNSSHTSLMNNTGESSAERQQLPADIRLNMLTGAPTMTVRPRSSVSPSSSTGGERTKDALVRINELIRQNSVQDVESKIHDDVFDDNDVLLAPNDREKQQQRLPRSNEISPIQFYINETNKLTSNLEASIKEQLIDKEEQSRSNATDIDEMNIQQVSQFFQ